ncbi:MAG: heavy metal translocating P-type ATPase metal-binding domain-containing protein [Candidatus Kapabacteria bacterium]|nr:heavy metal translocating P-type ATPase metal-binding domain-containing protein [Candidatus Kapabacteria bacterium]
MKPDELICFHCGDVCPDDTIRIDNKYFCCNGCKTVHILLSDNDLTKIYEEARIGSDSKSKFDKDEFSFLDDNSIVEKLLKYNIENRSKVIFYLPQIYCSACLYLIENIHLLENGVLESKVNFLRKEVSITFDNQKTSLRKIVELLTLLGYRPTLNLSDIEQPRKIAHNRSLYIKLGIAGFAFGNIMLMAIPEYLSGGTIQSDIRTYMGYISILLSIPVMYAASDYFKGAWHGLKMKTVNIDVPLSLGILVLFLRSVYDILFTTDSGFIDSLTGLVFFLLLGKLFQQKTYHNLSFNRDFKSYFPLSVIKSDKENDVPIPVNQIVPGDLLSIRHDELIPADSILESESALIDYSFVTGESSPITAMKSDKIYAGGKHKGSVIKIRVMKKFSSSYLTELWNSKLFEKQKESTISNLSNTAAKYFTAIVLLIAIATAIYWIPKDMTIAMNSITAVLIIACPCAIALSIPFSYGTTMRLLGKRKMFLKTDKIVEYMSSADVIVFDKTGTLTELNKSEISFNGSPLDKDKQIAIKSIVKNSTHPLSNMIYNHLNCGTVIVDDYDEVSGKGLMAFVGTNSILLGSKSWLIENNIKIDTESGGNSGEFNAESRVYVAFNGAFSGFFAINSSYRQGLKLLFDELLKKHEIYILSGDNDSERNYLQTLTSDKAKMQFNMLPADKLEYISKLQQSGKKVIMIGDGLNDAGALNQSDVGIAVSEQHSNFTPGSDAILIADELPKLTKLLALAKNGVTTVKLSYILSFVYHSIGFFFAVQGLLSPLIAAILMPVSSISVIALTVGSSYLKEFRLSRKT